MYFKGPLEINFSMPCKFTLMSGIMPDYMHIVHLALGVDAIASVLIDVVDIDGLVAGATRDLRLGSLWSNYHAWAEATRGFACDFYPCFVCVCVVWIFLKKHCQNEDLHVACKEFRIELVESSSRLHICGQMADPALHRSVKKF